MNRFLWKFTDVITDSIISTRHDKESDSTIVHQSE